MEAFEIKRIEKYLYNEIVGIVETLFEKLEFNGINVGLGRDELNELELEAYLKIYNQYEKDLIKLKEKVIKEYGYFENFDMIFAIIIQDVVSKKQEL